MDCTYLRDMREWLTMLEAKIPLLEAVVQPSGLYNDLPAPEHPTSLE
jgi:hypothetical protein